MNLHFKITDAKIRQIRADLERPHSFAWERVGFLSAGLAASKEGVLILADEYRPVADEDYIKCPQVGALIGSEAIRKALEWADFTQRAVFHVHEHFGRGIPKFSAHDIHGNARVMPAFFGVAEKAIHGAILLSEDAARGQVWLTEGGQPVEIDQFTVVGSHLRRWTV